MSAAESHVDWSHGGLGTQSETCPNLQQTDSTGQENQLEACKAGDTVTQSELSKNLGNARPIWSDTERTTGSNEKGTKWN